MKTKTSNANEMVSASTYDAENMSMLGSDFTAPDIIEKEEIDVQKYIRRITEEEKDLNTFVFANEDGSRTMRVFDHPVKYVDENGLTKDISLSIDRTEDGRLSSSQHMVDVVFNTDLKDGINLKYQDIDITMKADVKCDEAKLSDDYKKVNYVENDRTSYVYSLTYAGFKEDIVVDRYTGQTEYGFIIYTNGLHPIRKDGSIYLAAADDDIKALIGDIIILAIYQFVVDIYKFPKLFYFGLLMA